MDGFFAAMTHAIELTPDEFLALQQYRVTQTPRISDPAVVTSLEDKGLIARSDTGWTVTRQGEERFRVQSGDDARQR